MNEAEGEFDLVGVGKGRGHRGEPFKTGVQRLFQRLAVHVGLSFHVEIKRCTERIFWPKGSEDMGAKPRCIGG